MARKLAVKRLSAVEVRPDRSHQHEFHAGRLRTGLGFQGGEVRGTLELHLFQRGGTVIVDTAPYTLHQSREGRPRSPEWRLYYGSTALPEHAEEGDLLVLFRPDESNELIGVVAPAESTVESRLLELLAVGRDFDLRRFLVVDPPPPSDEQAAVTAAAISLWEEPDVVQADRPYVALEHPIIDRAAREGRIPGTVEMAGAAQELVAHAVDPAASPDEFLVRAMQAETDLYFRVEATVQERNVDRILERGRSVPELLKWAMTVHQSRRSRRGQSLQLHFVTILGARRIPYTAQCTTEAGRTPDFVMPGCAQYRDPFFPVDRLRMVACKTTSRERWQQIPTEAARIRRKYLLTVDPGLTAPTIEQMVQADVVPFLPRAVLAARYEANPARRRLGSVADLLRELEAVSL
jgi:hypothetical protein